jgi:hypothetical protein
MNFPHPFRKGQIANFLLLLLGFLTLSNLSHAQTVTYKDTFAGPAGPINGRTPSLTNTTGKMWTADPKGGLITDSTYNIGKAIIPSSFESAFLPITLDGTSSYTLSAVIIVMSVGGGGITMGFVSTTSTKDYGNGANPKAWIMAQQGSGCVQTHCGAANAAGYNQTVGAHTYSITLDSASGTITFRSDGVLLSTVNNALTAADISSITGVGFGSYSGSGYIDNFTLSKESKDAPPHDKLSQNPSLPPGSY